MIGGRGRPGGIAGFAAAVALALLVIPSIAGCGLVTGMGASGPQVVGPGQLPARPMDAGAVEPVVQVAAGAGPGGPYRVWLYRVQDGSFCLEVAMVSSTSSSCGSDQDDVLQPLSAQGLARETVLAGGTRKPGATAVEITLVDGRTFTAPLIVPAAGVVDGNVRMYAVPLPLDGVGRRLSILDALGGELETFGL